MNMILKKLPKDIFARRFDYQKAEELVARAAHRWYVRSLSEMENEKDREESILQRLTFLSAYMKQTMSDSYTVNLVLVFLGCRNEGISLLQALKNMERLRLHLLRQQQYTGKTAYPLQDTTRYIFDPRASTRLKCLMRFAVAREQAMLLYQLLSSIRSHQGRTALPKEDFMGFPAMVADKLDNFVNNYPALCACSPAF